MTARALLTSALVLAAASSGCGSGGTDSGATRRGGVTTHQARRPAFGDYDALTSGKTYTTAVFQPAIRFRLPPGKWGSEAGDSPRHFAIASTAPPKGIGQAIIEAHRVDRVFDPRRGGRIPADEVPLRGGFADWLRHHPRLRTTRPRRVRLLGLGGVQIDVAARNSPPRVPEDCGKVGPHCVPLLWDGIDNISYSAWNRGRFIVLSRPQGGELVIEEFVEPETRFAAGLRLLRPLLQSLQLAA
jgi:hypothetical protein